MATIWNLLTLEDLRELTDEQLTRRINDRLNPNPLSNPNAVGPFLGVPADYVAAQFYLAELNRRESERTTSARDAIERRRWRIDFALELLIVLLIGLEIWLSVSGMRQQSREAARQWAVFGQMEDVLSNLQQSSKATADTLVALKPVMESMNRATRGQLALSYDPSVIVKFNGVHQLQVLNAGRTRITLWGSSLAGQAPEFLKTPTVLPPNGGYEFNGESLFEELSGRYQRHGSISVPYSIYMKDELGAKFEVDCTLTVVSDTMGMRIVTQIDDVSRRQWGKR